MICRISSTCMAGPRCEFVSELKDNQTLKIHYFRILFQLLSSWDNFKTLTTSGERKQIVGM